MGHLMVIVAGGLIAGNFIYQVIGDQLWGVALERSLFQASGVAMAYLVARSWNAGTNTKD